MKSGPSGDLSSENDSGGTLPPVRRPALRLRMSSNKTGGQIDRLFLFRDFEVIFDEAVHGGLEDAAHLHAEFGHDGFEEKLVVEGH